MILTQGCVQIVMSVGFFSAKKDARSKRNVAQINIFLNSNRDDDGLVLLDCLAIQLIQ